MLYFNPLFHRYTIYIEPLRVHPETTKKPLWVLHFVKLYLGAVGILVILAATLTLLSICFREVTKGHVLI